ncbi:hypothetical protein [Lacipirellula parvula]|uniref:Uncharacterized protein n=1 Tax=Lacipirellula parvula TaxID=2650471 RepID=A0A5K7XGT5_9BACT|nr:hypothetical protein [Lacipirellula parvula]BBO36114.1 hypothetical protein PLANPX_5726 [Lacipirellula parvula]
MSIEHPQTPLDPVVRFRIRTVLTVTTIAAVAAATPLLFGACNLQPFALPSWLTGAAS